MLAQHIQRKSVSPLKMNDEILDNLHDEYDNEDDGDYSGEQAEGLEDENDPSCLQQTEQNQSVVIIDRKGGGFPSGRHHRGGDNKALK